MKKVLIVDDEPDILRVITFRLKKAGYEVFTAENGQSALDLIYANKPDLILLDLRMPIMSGDVVCAKIKKDNALKDIPIILLTASSGAKNAENIKAIETDDYLIKPFEPEVLLEKVKKWIK
ncbi:MAG: response regulator [Candidatus Omnitrophota bacterium]|jgi:CheY-like chemotaxis protein